MKALTVQQPWAWAVLESILDYFIEPFSPKVRGYFLIHAGLGWSWELEEWLSEMGIRPPESLPRGSIVGYARLRQVRLSSSSSRTPPISGFLLKVDRVEQLPPVPVVGRRGFWPIYPYVEEALQEQLPAHVRAGAL